MNPSEPVVTTLVCFVSFRTRGCGCSERPAFPAPSVLREAKRFLQNSDASRRENAELCFNWRRHCEERKRRSNPASCVVAKWIASRSLSSGAHSRDPLARNDDTRTTPSAVIARLDRATQYSEAPVMESKGRGVLDTPLEPVIGLAVASVPLRACRSFGVARHPKPKA